MKLPILIFTIACFAGACHRSGTTENATKSVSTSTTAASTENAVPFRIVESTYVISDSFGDVYVKWAAIIDNPNANTYGLFPTITITARDESGAVIATDDLVLSELPPGLKIACSGQLSAKELPATVEFNPAKVEWKPTRTRAEDYRAFGAEKVRLTNSGKDLFKITGDIVNPYNEELDSLRVVALLRDAEGKLLGGDTAYLNGLPANGTRPFEVQYIHAKGKPASSEISVYPHGVTTWNKLVLK